MPLIEGIGDEVTIGIGVFILICLVLLAWVSTHTRDIPFVSIIVVELSQRRSLIRRSHPVPSSEDSSLNQTSSGDPSFGGNADPEGGVHESGDSSSTQECLLPVTTDSENCVGIPPTDATVTLPDGQHSEILACEITGPIVSQESPPGDSNNQANTDGIEDGGVPADNTKETSGVSEAASALPSESSTDLRNRRLAYFDSMISDKDSVQDCHQDGKLSISPPVLKKSLTTEEDRFENISSGSSAVGTFKSKNVNVTNRFQQDEDVASESSAPSDGDSQQIRVRLKYLNDTQRLVYASPQETIGNFRRTNFASELEENKVVRFIFNGQDLRNDLSTLSSYNVNDNSVVHCLITQSRLPDQTIGAHVHSEDSDFQLGTFMFPVFGLILGLLWYLRFSYKQYFNTMSTFSLAGVSFIFMLAIYSSFRNRRWIHQHLE